MAERRLNDWRDWPLDLVEILRALQMARVKFVVIGGVAGLVHGMPLPTYDLDIMLASGVANRRRLLAALGELDGLALPDEPDEEAASSVEQALAEGRDVSFFTPHGYLDVVASPAGIRSYSELRRHAETVTVADDVEVPVAALRDLIRSKLAAGRDRDRTKLVALQTVAELQADHPKP